MRLLMSREWFAMLLSFSLPLAWPQGNPVSETSPGYRIVAPASRLLAQARPARRFAATPHSEPASGPVPPVVPGEYRDLYASLEGRLAEIKGHLDTADSQSRYAVNFSAELLAADNIQMLVKPEFYESAITPYLNGLESMSVKGVKVQMGFPILYEPFFTEFLKQPALYQEYLAFYKRLVADVHRHGMKYIAQCQEVQAERGRFIRVREYFQTLSFGDYQARRSEFLVNVARQLKPDYLLVQTEPDTEASNSGRPELLDPVKDARMITRFLADLQDAGAHTMVVGCGMGSWLQQYRELTDALVRIPDLDLIDIHIYPINIVGRGDMWQRAEDIANTALAHHKKVGVSECWLYKSRSNELGHREHDELRIRNVFSFWAPLDQQFIQAMVKLATIKQMDFMSVNWSMHFFSYLDYDSTERACGGRCSFPELNRQAYSAARQALRQGSLSDTGRTYSALIRQSTGAGER